MFNGFSSPTVAVAEEIFVNNNFIKNIECMVPTTELMVNFQLNGLKMKKLCVIYAEKMEIKRIIQLRIVEKCDQRKMYITTVDMNSFQGLKQEQSLHVTFPGFIENLIHILQDCLSGKLEMCLVQSAANVAATAVTTTTDIRMNDSSCASHMCCNDSVNGHSSGNGNGANEFQLCFIEIRPFKNLTYLCLPSHLAPLNVVLFYANNTMNSLQKKCHNQKQTIDELQTEITKHLRHIDHLDRECLSIREKNSETLKTLQQQHAEEIGQLQDNLRKINEQRQHDSDKHRQAILSLQSQLEKLKADNVSLQAEKLHAQKCHESVNEELQNLKERLMSIKEQNDKYYQEISERQNAERKMEMHLQDARKEVNNLKEKLKKYDKNKAEIVAELEAEKKISQTKRRALEMLTEEMTKANEIIAQQTQEILKLKNTVNWRTEIALQQEQIVQQKENVIKDRDMEIVFLKDTIETLRTEIPKELDSLKQFTKTLELKYSKQIEVLKSRMKLSSEKENAPPN